MMITSLQNDKVKHVRALQSRRRTREKEQQLVFEGLRLVEEAVAVGAPIHFTLYTPDLQADARGARLIDDLRALDVPCYPVSEAVMEACSDTETPQGVLSVLPIPAPPLPARPTLALILDQVRDPGNLGTIMRTALAAGVEQLWLSPGTVDFSNPKVVRAAMGAHLHLPVAAADWDVIAQAVAHCAVWLADVGAAQDYAAVDWRAPVALIVGGEAQGAGPQARSLARGRVRIAMRHDVESLNTAVATAVILFEIVRQRG
jgi:TrmH family RNA methyltransferase